jgi:hypothetical protein
VTDSDWFKPPAPVTPAEHGSCADPLNVKLTGHVTRVVEDAFSIVIVAVAEAGL